MYHNFKAIRNFILNEKKKNTKCSTLYFLYFVSFTWIVFASHCFRDYFLCYIKVEFRDYVNLEVISLKTRKKDSL